MSLVKRKELMNFECPKCGCNRVEVFYSMDDSTWLAKEEIRVCPSCGSMVYNKVYTYPKPVNVPKPTLSTPVTNPFSPTVKCPYCNSTNTKKISTLSRIGSFATFGFAGKKVGKQWHCNNCKSDF